MSPQETRRGPDFLAIGPPKTGTTWMYAMLKLHPDVWLPPVKEIRYLWERHFVDPSGYLARFTSDHWHFRGRRAYYKIRIQAHVRDLLKFRLDRERLLWDLRFSLFPHSDSWYEKLFHPGLVSGDISPKYCELPDSEIERIRSRYPHLKIVISLRNPIEREWSRAKMNLCRLRQRDLGDVPHEEWIEQFDDPIHADTNDYLALYRRWAAFFGEQNVHVVFFDDLVSEGWRTLVDLSHFLGLKDPPEALRGSVKQGRNVGIQAEIPEAYARYLGRKHRDRIDALAQTFVSSPHPGRWLNELDARLQAIRP